MAKKDGTILEIKITMKIEPNSDGEIKTNIDKTYCDDDFENISNVFMFAIVAALSEASETMNEETEND